VSASLPRPYALLAELTYDCPLHCPYCSNPAGPLATGATLPAETWKRVIGEAAAMGVLHVGFSGGEPLRYPALDELVAHARSVGLFTNLITSAVGLSPARIDRLNQAGLDSIQISFQSDQAELANEIAGTRAHDLKLQAAAAVRTAGIPLSVNVVLHRGNLDRIEEIIALAEHVGAERLELASTQYYGWAFQNRAALLPTREQIDKARASATAAKKRLAGKMEVLYVLPDYFNKRPKPCMQGWGMRFLTVNPAGEVLPCPTAKSIPNLAFASVQEHDLKWIWGESDAFTRFRGTEWLADPCKSCEFREIDFGGCRCQAALLTGDASVTDPVCEFSPHRHLLDEWMAGSAPAPWVARQNPETTVALTER
jgi:PqqA peptide cyclase